MPIYAVDNDVKFHIVNFKLLMMKTEKRLIKMKEKKMWGKAFSHWT